MTSLSRRFCGAFLSTAIAASTALAQESDDLAKQLANPVANLVSVPLQSNYDFDLGEEEGFRYTLNVQPVLPMELNDRWNLISRTIVPIVYQTAALAGTGDQFGLGDTLQSFFFSPKEPTSGGLIWGVGPAVLLPTATDDALGADQWAAGPTVVVLKQRQAWTFGVLANQVWSLTDDDDRDDVSSTFVQPFLNYTVGAVTYGVNFEGTYDWNTERWNLPLSIFRNQVMKIGEQTVSVGGGLKFYVDAPDDTGPNWGVRVNITLLYPR